MLSVGSKRGITLLEMMMVVTIIAVVAGISFPALTSGLAGVRLASSAGSVASFLTATMNTVERRQEPAAVVIAPRENRIVVYTARSGEKPANELRLPPGVTLEGDEPKRVLLFPGGAFPQINLTLRSEKGGRRSVEIDPVTAVPKIARIS
jgi:prepilin-type N-terminal cleavage/methylation domain-containing protein